jgi:formamidopyrimidine-DNA glycosylase
MFELPEFVNLSKQMNEILIGKKIKCGNLGNTVHKFVWYNRTPDEFQELTAGKILGVTSSKGKWLFIPLNPGYVLLIGECGGKILYHPSELTGPKKYHLHITFEDNSYLTATTQMWGAYELYTKGKEQNRDLVKNMKITPNQTEFTFEYFCALIDSQSETGKRSVKGLLTQDQLIPGLGNAITQDILFKAKLHPKQPIIDLKKEQKRKLYEMILETVYEVIEKGGRNDEYDLYNNQGNYKRIMDKNAVNTSCPQCGSKIDKIQYLGGACYFCLNCQKLN